MNPMLCRFYGRFVMVERVAADGLMSLTLLMPDMTFGGSGLRKHKALMTIARHFVDHRQTTLPPTFRNMTDGKAQEAEDFVWDLTGWTIDVGAQGGVTMSIEKGKEIVDLAELEGIQGRSAKLKARLEPGIGGIVSAAILVGGGQGEASAAFHTPPCAFIALADAGNPPKTPPRPAKFQVDIIDITVPAAALHRVTLRSITGEKHHITLTAGLTPTIGLSNLCNELPHRVDIDYEFAQYYHVLETVAADRLVPQVALSLGDEDCNRQAKIRI